MLKKAFFLLLTITPFISAQAEPQKSWTIMIYIAADNDLEIFVSRNIKQMLRVGSNDLINIVIQVNMRDSKDQRKISKTIFIEKNNPKIIAFSSQANHTDSGDPQTLIDFCTQTIKLFPADNYALFFWDHGTGPIDPFTSRKIATSEIFQFLETQNRSQKEGFNFFETLQVINQKTEKYKGVCFDDTTGNFLTEAKLQFALKKICQTSLNGGKFDIIGFDACLMAMIETVSLVKNYAHIMVASQEVELGTGWDYKRVLSPFLNKNLTPKEFGKHIVSAYSKTYSFIDDFTLSCIDLHFAEQLEEKIKTIADLLHHGFSLPSNLVSNLLQKSRYKYLCTHFDEPDFIDLKHFLSNLLFNVADIALSNDSATEFFKKTLSKEISESIKIIENLIIVSKTGNFFEEASGISIYFPEHAIHRSYRNNLFGSKNHWLSLLNRFID